MFLKPNNWYQQNPAILLADLIFSRYPQIKLNKNPKSQKSSP
jgi:hypothetical protein